MPFTDLTGRIFGKLTVIRREPSKKRDPQWLCQCACGSPPRFIGGQPLRIGHSRSCGCARLKPIAAGHVFDRWTVIGGERNERTRRMFHRCRCICGIEKIVSAYHLLSGQSRSCGCLARELLSRRAASHGFSRHPLYAIWGNMHRRCADPRNAAYKDYGARGITVCERWADIAVFIEDMGERPGETTLDRIDNDKGYSPENCRWATNQQQQNNRRPTKPFKRVLEITAFGETLPVGEWMRRRGIPRSTLQYRLKRGWPAEKLFT